MNKSKNDFNWVTADMLYSIYFGNKHNFFTKTVNKSLNFASIGNQQKAASIIIEAVENLENELNNSNIKKTELLSFRDKIERLKQSLETDFLNWKNKLEKVGFYFLCLVAVVIVVGLVIDELAVNKEVYTLPLFAPVFWFIIWLFYLLHQLIKTAAKKAILNKFLYKVNNCLSDQN